LNTLLLYAKFLYLKLRNIYLDFSSEDALRIKEIESVTNHDVKAVEYFIKEEFDKLELQAYKEFIHFGLTSQDVNNTAIPLSIKEALNEVYLPLFDELVAKIESLAKEWANIPLLARTHGQTTQIEHYDHMAAQFDALKRINNIILDLDRDVWT